MSLWGDDFKEEISTKDLLSKVNSVKDVEVKKAIKSKKVPLEEKMALIALNVHSILGTYEKNTVVIKSKEQLDAYIKSAIKNKVIAIDTETNNSLDPLTCKLVGFCIYTPGEQNAYVPINHVDKFGRRLDWQCTEKDVADALSAVDNIKTIYHNGTFDTQVLYCTTGFRPNVFWDTLVGARLLNENEKAGLKIQYITHIDPSIEKYSIEHLFGGLPYETFDPELFALYAATDAYMTYRLYEYQLAQFKLPENKKLFKLFKDVEMQIIPVVADMELTGVAIDFEYSERLSKKYHKKLDEIDSKINDELARIKPQIDNWLLSKDAREKARDASGKLGKSKAEQLENPINIGSSTQMAILLYDILGSPVIDKEHPRGTGEDIIKQMPFPICKLILEKRSLNVLLNTFIDKLPQSVNPKDKRLHGHFNQLGADTGRFSSSDPNLQNIPSGETSVRLMFVPTDGYSMIGSDYSSQEPRIMAAYAQDKALLDSLSNGLDPYAFIASKIYHNKYEDNLETYLDGSLFSEGKHRRKSVKSLLLGLLYGMSTASLAEKLKCDVPTAQKILSDFFDSFPEIKKWISATEGDAKKNGYVEDLWGRKRRLPDLLLPKYSITSSNSRFNPFLHSLGEFEDGAKIEKYRAELDACKNVKETRAIETRAKADGINIVSNGGFISRAERQCVNARIQGGAATMTKKAMILIRNDEEMKRLGFRLLLAVHDELIGEAPTENAEKASERLSYLMRIAAQPECMVTMKCDALTFPCWYWDVRSTEVADYVLEDAVMSEKSCDRKQAVDLIEKMDGSERKSKMSTYINNNFDKVIQDIKQEFSELLEDQLRNILFDNAA